MDATKPSHNSSSLFDLKAELHKKYESFRKAKIQRKEEHDKPSPLKFKHEPVAKQKFLNVTDKPSEIADNEKKDIDFCKEEDLALQKSRKALEAKAKLYEKIISQKELVDDEVNEQYMVNFNRKILYEPIEPVDKSPEVKTLEDVAPASDKQKFNNNIPTKLISKDCDELNSKSDGPIHYQDVQFNEIRDHGVGYFAFSTDEAERKKQMEEFKSMRRENEANILAAQRMQRKRKAILEARLAKVCDRRNIDKSVIESYTKTQDEEQTESATQNIDLASIPVPEVAPKVVEKKETKIRPWDVGKTEFQCFIPEKRKIKTQNDWINERRSERHSEFAPPQSYKYYE